MPLMSEKEYIRSLRDLGTVVFIEGEKVENPVDHPLARPSANAVAMTYKLAGEAEHEELLTAESHITGKKINRFTHIQRNREDLLKKVKMERLLGQKTASCFQRCAGLDGMNSVYAVTHDMDAELGTSYHKRFCDFLVRVQEDDLVVAAAMTDPKGDRSLAPHGQPDPDQYLRVVDERDDGIVVQGAKMHITGCTNSHWVMFMPTRALREEEGDYAVVGAVPMNAPGIKIIYGRQSADTRKSEYGGADSGNKTFGGCEGIVVFDGVFVPNEQVFMLREWQYAQPLIELFASLHRVSYGGCKVGVGDVLIGATALVAEVQGTARASHVRDKIVEMVHLNETLHAGGLAASVNGTCHASGAWRVDYLLGNVCKQNVTRFPFEIARLAQDIAGGILATMPSVSNLENEEIGPYVRKFLATSEHYGPEDRMNLIRLIENLTLGAGAVSYLTESVHGAGSPQAQRIMIQRIAPFEKMKNLAREIAGVKAGPEG